jgi:hypothetical protein
MVRVLVVLLAAASLLAACPRTVPPAFFDGGADEDDDGGAAGTTDGGGGVPGDAGFVAVDGGFDEAGTPLDGGFVPGDAGFAPDDAGGADDAGGPVDAGATLPQPAIGPYDLVTDAVYTKLVIEIDAITGHGPDPDAIALAVDALEALVDRGSLEKPGGIEVRVDDDDLPASADADHAWTFAEQQALSNAHRDDLAMPGEAFIHMIYLDGKTDRDTGSSQILGYAYGNSFIAMFRDNIDESCASATALQLAAPSIAEQACDASEATVLLHEIGHLLGLVDNGLAMAAPHEDADHPKHDVNEDCLMYWVAETSDAIDVVAAQVLAGDPIATFDAACLADLDAAAALD